jgi:hypothetical protein
MSEATQLGQGMNETGLLGHWPLIRDLGALIGLITGLVSVFKFLFQEHPFSYLEPDGMMKGIFKLYVFNAAKRPIVINKSCIFPQAKWYIAPNARHLTSDGIQHPLHGSKAPTKTSWHDHNVIIEPGKQHQFFLGLVDRHEKPPSCFIVTRWRPLGGLPLPRWPLLLYSSKAQMGRLTLALKGHRDTEL